MAINYPIVFKVDKKGLTAAENGLKQFGKAAAATAAAATAALAGIATASVAEFAKFDQALVKSQAIMGDLSDALKTDMEQAARDVAKTTTFSAEQAAESYYFLASAGLDAAASIAAMPQVAKFAQAGMFDMALATDLATDAQSALGLSSKDAEENLENLTRVTDVFARSATLANTSVEQIAVALTTKAGTALKTVGKDIEEGAAALAVFADQGVKGEQAGTQLTNTIFGLSDRAKAVPAQFEALGISVFDASGEMNNFADIADSFNLALGDMSTEQKLATLSNLGFTKQARAGLLLLIENGDQLRNYEEQLRSAGGTVDEIANNQLSSFSNQLELAKSRVADVGISIGQALAPSLLSMADELIPIVDELAPSFVEFFKSLTPAIKGVVELVPVLLGAFSALLPVLLNIGNFIGEVLVPNVVAFGSWVLNNIPVIATFVGVFGGLLAVINATAIATKVLTAAKAALLVVMAINPFVLLAAAIAAIAAGIVYLATQTTFFQDLWRSMTIDVSELWEGFGRVFGEIGEAIVSFFGTLVNNLAEGWQNTMTGLGSGLEWFASFFETIWRGLTGFFKNVVNGYIGIWQGFIDGVIGGINGIIRAANSIQISIPSWVPGLGGRSFGINLPTLSSFRIPRLAEGGIVMPQPGGVLANIAEGGQAEAVIPLDRLGKMGGNNITINVNAGMGTDGRRVGQQIVEEIIRYEKLSGKVFARA